MLENRSLGFSYQDLVSLAWSKNNQNFSTCKDIIQKSAYVPFNQLQKRVNTFTVQDIHNINKCRYCIMYSLGTLFEANAIKPVIGFFVVEQGFR